MKPNAGGPEWTIRQIYRTLNRAWGPQHWWPAETPFEVIVGAILTQNTSWTNVERALGKLREAGLLSIEAIRDTPLADLEQLVRSSGYYRQKAERLKHFIAYLDREHNGSLEKLFAKPTDQLRAGLLSLKGIGPETADSILLYAGNCDIFVVDAYTRRVLGRHDVISDTAKYDQIRALVERALRSERTASDGQHRPERLVVHQPSAMSQSSRSPLSQTFNEMHGLLVQVGKHHCWKTTPDCEHCPLKPLLSKAL